MIDSIARNIDKDLTIIKNCGFFQKFPELMYFMTLSSLIYSENCTKASSNRVKVSPQIVVFQIIEAYFFNCSVLDMLKSLENYLTISYYLLSL